MIYRSTEEFEASVSALEDSFNWDHSSFPIKNLEERILRNLVVIGALESPPEGNLLGTHNYAFQTAGTGLLLTQDGFVLTAYHNIQAYLEEWFSLRQLLDHDGLNANDWIDQVGDRFIMVNQRVQHFPLDISSVAYDKDLDLALVKAVTRQAPLPIPIRMIGKEMEIGEEMQLFALRGLIPYAQFGQVCRNVDYVATGPISNDVSNRGTLDPFLTTAYATPGFSGGVFTNMAGEYAGMVLFKRDSTSSSFGLAGGAKARNVESFVNDAIRVIRGSSFQQAL